LLLATLLAALVSLQGLDAVAQTLLPLVLACTAVVVEPVVL
jgi:hypothetical protein